MQSTGLTDEQYDRLSSLHSQIAAGTISTPEIVSRPDLAYTDAQGNTVAANARFNRLTGQIEVDSSLIVGANTAAGAADLLAALHEEHAEWALHTANVNLGRIVDSGGVVGFGAMLEQMGNMARQGQSSLNYSVMIDGSTSSYQTNINSMFDTLGGTFESSRLFANVQDESSSYQRGGARQMRTPQMAMNGRAADLMDVISNGDALGLIPEAYRDIKQIAAMLDNRRLNGMIDAAKERLQKELGPRNLPTPEALGVTLATLTAPGQPVDNRPAKRELLDRYLDGMRKVRLARDVQITMDYSNFEIKTIGNENLTPAQYREAIETRYQRAFSDAVADGKCRYDARKLPFPSDMPEQLQVGLYADQAARTRVLRFNESLGLREGPGQLLSMNRWSYDMQGSGQYVRPDLMMDFGPGRRYWVDGKTSSLNLEMTQQFRNFNSYTGASGGKVASPSGLYEMPNTPRQPTYRIRK